MWYIQLALALKFFSSSPHPPVVKLGLTEEKDLSAAHTYFLQNKSTTKGKEIKRNSI